MGLDMYAYAVRKEAVVDETDFVVGEGFSKVQEWYWRKFNEMHSWMEKLYYTKGGKAESFNCVNVHLSRADLEKLKEDAQSGNIQYIGGLFWGSANHEEDVVKGCVDFAEEALQYVEQGYKIYYSSWW